jgi:hypothetical protein
MLAKKSFSLYNGFFEVIGKRCEVRKYCSGEALASNYWFIFKSRSKLSISAKNTRSSTLKKCGYSTVLSLVSLR